MRSFGIGSLFCVLSLAIVQFGIGQDQEKKRPEQPGGRPGFPGGFQGPGGFGGFGGRGGSNELNLVNQKAIQEELKLSEEQISQIPEAVSKAVTGVLTADQAKRLKQIELQQRGTGAFSDEKVAEKLGLSAEQKKDIKTILEDSRKEIGELFKGGREGNFGESFKKVAALRKETEDKVKDVLTSDQKKTWKQMVGEEFKMPTPTFGRPGGENNTPPRRPEFKKKSDA